LYGEIVGHGIQKGYAYGCGEGEHMLYVYDIAKSVEKGKPYQYLSYEDFKRTCSVLNLPTVPELYLGPYNYDTMKELTQGASTITPDQKVREGTVIKPVFETTHHSVGRKVLKFISDEYLLDANNSDWH
jgi:hypothetical protein